ncbi:MAG: transcriptional repressor [Actinobacteria bacterium]|nr:transcriptional repressor [Actinomycetota bacterium]
MAIEQTTEPILKMLRQRGFRITPQRRAILSEVMRSKDHINAAGLATRVSKRVPGVNASTVYRTLGLLDDLGVLTHAHFEDGVEYHRAAESEHVHLTCSSCGTDTSLPRSAARPLERLIHERHGFSADLTHFAISGLCQRCQAGKEA